ncbi:hypothetical protein P7F88_18720 [Vibrio hannami]|uniref:hypothetical protein n=1 Tax=Vibrio hannami TaxID=2717094 RepID=UPI0024108A47|nr:hypothetical protein [Vibrio hannami]MDG3088001.1 hypothetical protein [Vibrio hannami]
MLQVNNYSQLHTYINRPVVGNHSESSDVDAGMYHQLATLSHKRLWVLFTSQCPRPVQSELTSHGVNCQNVIHMKPSVSSTEEEIVLKAIQARTASAVVASNNLSQQAKTNILSCAAESGCEVFFMSANRTHIH